MLFVRQNYIELKLCLIGFPVLFNNFFFRQENIWLWIILKKAKLVFFAGKFILRHSQLIFLAPIEIYFIFSNFEKGLFWLGEILHIYPFA